MKKFKRFFYPIYILVAIFAVLGAYNVDLVMRWGWVEGFSQLFKVGRNMVVLLCVMMLVELIIENIHLVNNRKSTSHLKSDIIHLKAKLYDKSQEEVAKEGFTELEDEEETDDESDFADNDGKLLG